MEPILVNKNYAANYDEKEKCIHGADKTDNYNGTVFFTKGKRGLLKAWETLKAQHSENLTYWQAVGILSDNGAKPHSYCSVD